MAAGARALEAEAHAVLRGLGLGLCGEWFDIGIADARNVLDKCGDVRGVRPITLAQVAGAETNVGLDRDMYRAQQKIIASMASVAMYVHNHQPYPLDGGPK